MKKIILGLLTIALLTSQAFAHSGRTDKDGGHKCSEKSIEKGLCTGYHYHNKKLFANNAIGHEHHATHKHDNDHKLTKGSTKTKA